MAAALPARTHLTDKEREEVAKSIAATRELINFLKGVSRPPTALLRDKRYYRK